jgi:hypothetical protein
VDGVAPLASRLLMASINMLTPNTSDARMNSCRFSSDILPVRVSQSIAVNHSCGVGSTSRTKPCRCLIIDVIT